MPFIHQTGTFMNNVSTQIYCRTAVSESGTTCVEGETVLRRRRDENNREMSRYSPSSEYARVVARFDVEKVFVKFAE